MELCTSDQVKELLLRNALGYQPRESQLFQDGNLCLPKFVKRGIVREFEAEDEKPSSSQGSSSSFVCNVPGCVRTFDNVRAYESHYNSLHRYGCSTCHKNLPSAHLLDLHIQETHDSFFAVQAERKPMYSCYIEECKEKSVDARARRDHCIKHHKFPHDFRFDKIPPNRPVGAAEKMETDEGQRQLPKTFHFGHHVGKTFPKPPSKSILENDALLDDLMESLPQS